MGSLTHDDKDIIEQVLEKTDTLEYSDRKCYQLSDGQLQRVFIARALVQDTPVIILDEPFANLDPTTQIRLKQIIKKLTDDRNITVLISSHDLMHVTEVCERIVVLEKGEIIKDLKTSAATLKELEAHFGSATEV